MSAVWPTTWQLLGIGLQNAPSKLATLSTARQFFKRTLITYNVPTRSISGGPNKTSKFGYDIKFSHCSIGSDNHHKNLHSIKGQLKKTSFSTSSQIWKPSSPGGIEPSKHAKSAIMNVSDSEIRAIFGGSLDKQRGNELLQILQNQRVSGTLDQETEASPIDIVKALAWLRIKIPVDEDQAIIARLEKEEIEDERNHRLEAGDPHLYQPQQGSQKHGIYGESAIEGLREHNKRKEVEREEKEKKKKEEETPRTRVSPSKALIERQEKRAQWIQHYKDQAQRKGKFITEMTKFERLGPSTVVAISIVLISILFAHFYTPPSRKARLWPDVPPAAATVICLTAMNVIVFVVWRVPPAWKFMNKHFIMTAAQPFSSSIICSIFSHHQISHLARNMLVLWLIGTRLHDDIGRGQFLALYFSAGAMASLASLSSYVLRNLLHTSSLGASGAICGLLACWVLLHADDTLILPFMAEQPQVTQLISLPAVLSLFIIHDFVGLRRGQFGPQGWAKIDYAAHLGGYAAGIGAGQSLRVRARQRRRAEIARKKGIES